MCAQSLICVQLFLTQPGSSVPGVFQARILEWFAISSSRGSSQPRDRTQGSCIGSWILYHRATWKCPLRVKHYRKMSSGPKNSLVKAMIFLSTLWWSKVRDLWKLNNFSHSHIASKWQSWDSDPVRIWSLLTMNLCCHKRRAERSIPLWEHYRPLAPWEQVFIHTHQTETSIAWGDAPPHSQLEWRLQCLVMAPWLSQQVFTQGSSSGDGPVLGDGGGWKEEATH